MNRDRRALQILDEALSIAQDLRPAFLESACGGDASLRGEVEALVKAADEPGELLATPARDGASTRAIVVDAMESARGQLHAGRVLASRYEIVKLVGVGGMGEVYEANDQRLNRKVAIKVMKLASLGDPETHERFALEARSVAALSHPNIVTLHDLTEDGTTRFAVMEFVTGKTLRELIEEGIGPAKVVRLAGQIAAGLSSAHSLGVMHRDIKPENVIVAADGRAKILDFGLARPEQSGAAQELTAARSAAPGTVPYMSPEQAEGRELTCATDIFSLGTVLCEALTGANPFRRESGFHTLQSIAEVAPSRELAWPVETPQVIVELVESMWARRPADRPTAADVIDRLRGWPGKSAAADRGASGAERQLGRPARSPTNLPPRPAELTGRDAEIARILAELRDGPLITIVGPGGVGKTALAIEAARRAQQEYPGGVWLCEFATATDEASVAEVLTATLDGAAGSINGIDQVVTRLREDPTLLVLDNCEHVIESVAELADQLIRGTSDLAILATSREPLEIPHERVDRIEGLPTQGPESSAVELFVRRASAPGRGWNADQRRLVEQIVDRLEGLPLAIELAASQLSAMSLEELLEALDDQMETLQSSRRSRGRQAAMGLTIGWSFELLAPKEQELLLASSIFAGSFTAESATRVSGIASGIRRLLQRLVDQSMIVRTEIGGESRFRLLEPIRQFCASRIDQEAMRVANERHARLFAQRAVLLGKGLYGDHEVRCYHWLNAEWPDLRKAVAWGREHGVIEIAVDPIVAMDRAVWMQIRVEAYEWLRQVEQQLGDAFSDRADALAMLATARWVAGDAEQSMSYLNRSLGIEPTSSGLYLQLMSMFTQADRAEEAITIVRQARRLVDETGDIHEQRWWSLPFVALVLAPHAPADPRVETDLSAAKKGLAEIEWPTGNAFNAMALGCVAMYEGDHPHAARHFDEALACSESCGNRAISTIVGMMANGLAEAGLPERRLRSAVGNLRILMEAGSESGEASLWPAAVRSLVTALVACERWEVAARCAGALKNLTGVALADETSPGYRPAVQSVANELGLEAFETRQRQGSEATLADVVAWAEQALEALKT